nr:MAG TPA: hypothetical protein [Caudoviricetes sp.]
MQPSCNQPVCIVYRWQSCNHTPGRQLFQWRKVLHCDRTKYTRSHHNYRPGNDSNRNRNNFVSARESLLCTGYGLRNKNQNEIRNQSSYKCNWRSIQDVGKSSL